MRVIKTLTDASDLMQTLCLGIPSSLFILYDHVIPIKDGVAVCHYNRSNDSRMNLIRLKQELSDILNNISNWSICGFENIFIYGGFDEDEIDILKELSVGFKDKFNLTIDVQVWDQDLENKWLIEEI